MNTLGAILPKNYLVEEFYANSILKWKLISSSNGTSVVELEDLPQLNNELLGAVTITKATNDVNYFDKDRSSVTGLPEAATNIETGVQEHLLYKSIKQMFYAHNLNFISASVISTKSIVDLPDNSYIVSVGQQFYGESIKPTSFKLRVSSSSDYITDDGYGNLYISQSSVGTYIGNIFYDYGIAVIPHNTSSIVSYIGPSGIKIIGGSDVYVEYSTDVKINRHQINVVLKPTQFNLSIFNPSVHTSYLYATSSITQSLKDLNIPESGSNTWSHFSLMQAGIIKPYVTAIGLYNNNYELLAVAKLGTPIQRTFDTDQIFIVRFDT